MEAATKSCKTTTDGCFQKKIDFAPTAVFWKAINSKISPVTLISFYRKAFWLPKLAKKLI